MRNINVRKTENLKRTMINDTSQRNVAM